jgi:hypothetical protein
MEISISNAKQVLISRRTIFQMARKSKGPKGSSGALRLTDETISVVRCDFVVFWNFFNSPYWTQFPEWDNRT